MNPETQFQLVHIKLSNGKEGVFIGPAIYSEEEWHTTPKMETVDLFELKNMVEPWTSIFQIFFENLPPTPSE